MASSGVGTIYIFNITSIGSAVNPISELCALLVVQWGFVSFAAPQLSPGAAWAAKVSVALPSAPALCTHHSAPELVLCC